MAYTPKNWKDLPDETTPIQASDLNHIEQGIGDLSTKVDTLNTNVGNLSTLNTTEKSNLVGAINELYQNNVYSTDETVVGKWHDGKPIYRKIYYYNSITFTTGNHVLNIDLPNLDSVTGFKYSMWYPKSSSWYVNWDAIDAHNVVITSTKAYIGSGGENTTFTRASFVFEYTKTTD